MEEKYRNELNAHVKLSSLYKVRVGARQRGKSVVSSKRVKIIVGFKLVALFYFTHDAVGLPAGGSDGHGDQEPRTEQSSGGAQQAG